MSSATSIDPANPDRAVTLDGKKFLWDGHRFETHDDASQQAEAYRKDGFEVQIIGASGSYLVYSRRVVKEVVVSAP